MAPATAPLALRHVRSPSTPRGNGPSTPRSARSLTPRGSRTTTVETPRGERSTAGAAALAAIDPAEDYDESSGLFGRERFAPKQSRFGSRRSSGKKGYPVGQMRMRSMGQSMRLFMKDTSKSAKHLSGKVVDEMARTRLFSFMRGLTVGKQ